MFIRKPKGKEVEPSYYDIQGFNLSDVYNILAEDSYMSLESALKQKVREEFKFETHLGPSIY